MHVDQQLLFAGQVRTSLRRFGWHLHSLTPPASASGQQVQVITEPAAQTLRNLCDLARILDIDS